VGWCGDSTKSSERNATEEQAEGQEDGEAEGFVMNVVYDEKRDGKLTVFQHSRVLHIHMNRISYDTEATWPQYWRTRK